MSSNLLDPSKIPQLQPVYALWNQYHPENALYRFQASTPNEAREWQADVRPLLDRLIGFQDIPVSDQHPEVLECIDCGSYTREKILLHTTPHTYMPVYLLLPKVTPSPPPVVLAFHGHGYGVKDIVGLWEDGEERSKPDGYHKDFAVSLVNRGFAVVAPEISCFGERLTDFSYLKTPLESPIPYTCDHAAKLAFHLGGSVIGLRILDGKRLVDYLFTRDDIDATRLGAMGISGGGMHTFFSTCLDTRIKACVVSGYYSTFRDSILAMSHCTCNFVPGLHQFGEMYDLVGLIAPRPMLVEAASRDNIFPIEAVKFSCSKAEIIYNLFNAQNQFETDFFEGRHEISGRRAYDFLVEKFSLKKV
jgi:dienelactone hydrolase